jgi:proline utilization trans-activator
MSKSADNAYGIEVPSLRQHNTSFVSNWPTEDEAQNLLDIVLSSVGRIQHLFDPRTFADQLALRYTEDRLQIGESDLWHVEMLMVFAVGKLLRGNLDDDTQLPGENFFKEAMNNLPNLTHVYAAGTLGVEVMSLVAFYLQNADLKEFAHMYVSIMVMD